ncbi:MAG: translocation/assembly module TamB domain-containing protein, partial [Balneolaceae bacterium]
RQHLFNLRDPGNTLEMDTRIKDVSSLAPLLGIDNLQAGGEFKGNLYRRGDGELQFDADLRMKELVYDTLFTVDETTGSMSVLLLEDPEVELDLDIHGPAGNGFRLQLVSVAASTVLQDSLVNGSLSIDLRQDDDNSLFHSGSFEYMEDNLLVRTEEFVLRTPDRALSLQRPFDLSWKDRVVQMDTLHIESPGGSAYVQMSIPRLDENRQEVTVDARRLNLGTIQRLVLNESFAGALLSGRLHFIREGEDIRSGASLLLENIRMNDGSVDSLRAVADIDNNRLQTSIGAWFENEELLTVSGNVPFAADASPTPDDEFLEQPVEGEIRVPSRAISFWRQFLDEEIEFQSEGNFFFHSTLEGTAGDPALTGRVELTDGRLSGIPIDLVEFVFGYRHDSGNIRLDGSVHSRGSRIAGVEATLPLDMDMRTYQVNFPGDSDGIFVTARSDDLDLAILNDFLDPELMRDLRGRITGDFELNGTIGEPEPSGFLRLTGGSLRVIPTAVALSDMSMDVTMNPDRLRLDSFSVRSGPGRLTANGQVDLRDLQPGNLEINLSANQFRVANTADMNAIVDISSTLQGTSERPVLTGGVNFRSGFVNLQNFGEESVEDVRLEEDEEPGSMAFYDSLAVEMNVEFDRQFFIRNQQYLDMEVELAGILDLVKEPGADLEMFGSMEGVQGYAQPLGRNFEIDEAVVTFYGPIDNPEMNIRTFYTPPQADEEITLWYIIEGTVEDPEFSFESDPALELQDIISYTLFGRPFYALDSWQQAVSGGGQGTTAADVAMDLLLDRASIVASQQLGIDVVQIDTNRTGSGSATTIKTGWYLNNRTFFAVLNEIAGTSPKTMFQLEYMIRRNLELVITQGDDNREGVDLRWNFDY